MNSDNYLMLSKFLLEKSSSKITAKLVDEDNSVIPLSGANSLSGMTLTLYSMSDSPTCTIINSRNSQNVLNINNVSIDSLGNFIWNIQPEDTAILDSTLAEELHRAIFTWNYGSKTGRYVIDFRVVNLEKIT